MRILKKLLAVCTVLCLLLAGVAMADEGDRVSFFLLCNEGMNNDHADVGNTIIVVSMEPDTGSIRMLSFTWDTFINYEGYDTPQIIDLPFRINGPEATRDAFNANFHQDIQNVISVNYLALAGIIDSFGGVDVDISRAERNALNAMVASKKNALIASKELGLLEQIGVELLAQEYYLNDWGDNVHLNGLQAVAFGWLQYDSVYNCCLREHQVVSNLFGSLFDYINERAAFYTDDTGYPENVNGRRVINLDALTEDDEDYLVELVSPVFKESYNNIDDAAIRSISKTFARSAYLSNRQGVNVMKHIEYEILPLEALEPYQMVAGRKGHVVDYEANAAAITEFLYGDRD